MRFFVLVILFCCAAAFGSGAIEPPTPSPAPSAPKDEGLTTSYDDVIQDLVASLGRDLASAQDAAIKLGGLGKRSLPALTQALNNNYNKEKGNPQIALYATIALARIKSSEAARPLLPILNNQKAQYELRCAALTAIGIESLEEACAAVQKIAAADPDVDIRRKAYNRLLTMPKQWTACEAMFLEALNDPDTEIRTIASKQCYFAAKIYRDAAPVLIAAAENESVEAVRAQVFLALGSMQAREAVPTLVRIYTAENSSEKIQKLALIAINKITTMDFKDKAALQRWWEKFGEKEYTKYAQAMKQVQQKAAENAAASGTPAAPATPPIATPATNSGDATDPKPVEKR